MSSSKAPKPISKVLEENNMSQECKDLLSSLPSETHYDLTFCKYKGSWLVPSQLKGVLACQHFQARDTDILLVTPPKSGTTWLKALMFSLVNRGQYQPDIHNHPLLTNNPHYLVPYLDFDLYSDKQFPDMSSFPSPRLFATHMPWAMLPESVKNSSCKLVYLCRDPKDTFVSYWHHSSSSSYSVRDLPVAFDSFSRGISMYGPLWNHVLGYWRESLERSEKVLFLRYEEMKEKPSEELTKLAKFMGCPFSQEEEMSGLVEETLKLCGFENLSNLEVNKSGRLLCGLDNRVFFRRGVVGDWKNCLTKEMGDRLDRIYEYKFFGSGFKF